MVLGFPCPAPRSLPAFISRKRAGRAIARPDATRPAYRQAGTGCPRASFARPRQGPATPPPLRRGDRPAVHRAAQRGGAIPAAESGGGTPCRQEPCRPTGWFAKDAHRRPQKPAPQVGAPPVGGAGMPPADRPAVGRDALRRPLRHPVGDAATPPVSCRRRRITHTHALHARTLHARTLLTPHAAHSTLCTRMPERPAQRRQ